jgi:hypothetical protein
MYSKIITAVVLSAALVGPAMAGQTINKGHSNCARGKCAGHGALTGSHGAMTGSHGAMSGNTHAGSNVVAKPH